MRELRLANASKRLVVKWTDQLRGRVLVEHTQCKNNSTFKIVEREWHIAVLNDLW